ncbi:MAG: hypothetical protein ACKVQR_05975 [Aquabacterium sp.]
MALPSAAQTLTAPREASQFDFLIGQWDLDVTPKVGGLAAALHGAPKVVGTWKGWRAFDGFGVADELRIVDGSGNPLSFNHTLRVYDAKTRRWAIASLDVYRARISNASAQWQDGEMFATGNGTTPDGKPTLSRSRFHDIGPDRFRLRQDRSVDGGASWDDAVLVISARRRK